MKKNIRTDTILKINRKLVRKFLALSLTAVFLFIPSMKSKAMVSLDLKEESQTDLQERVFEEIRTGNITNDADIIKVALEQYQERKEKAARISERYLENNVLFKLFQNILKNIDMHCL